MPLSNHVW